MLEDAMSLLIFAGLALALIYCAASPFILAFLLITGRVS